MAIKLTLLKDFGAQNAALMSIDLPGQKDRALLAFLALPPCTTHSRDKLASLLWSDRDDRQARDSLKHSLTRLRRGLESVSPPPIVADRQAVLLDPTGLAVDVVTFERLVSEGTLESLNQAVALYRGDLLEGVSVRSSPFEDWLLIERQRLRHLFGEALTKLLGQLMAAGESELATSSARRLLKFDPLHEGAYCALMKIHADQAQLAQALKCYETLRERLHQELRVKPDPATTQLYEALRQRAANPALVAPVSLIADVSRPKLVSVSTLPEKPSIAVLPFDNLSGDPDQQYFSDGITEDIITELSRFRSLFVIARQSSFAFRGRSITAQEIARELGAAYIVEGSVRRVVDRVRISAKLIDAGTGNHLWAEKYDRDLFDIFSVQDDVARSVVAAVSGRVDVAGRDRIERLSAATLRAYDLVLRAKFLTSKYTRDDNAQALACAERAVELDPRSATAHAHSAWCHFYNYMACWAGNSLDSLGRSSELAQRAVFLDETDSFARSMLGIVHWFQREYEQARSEILAAVALNPNDFLARRYYGLFLAAVGEADRGIEQIELGRQLNPFETRWVPWNMGIVCFTARRYDEAITALKQARNPINEVRGWLAASFAHAGRLPEARAMLEDFLKIAETDMATFPGRRLKDWEIYWHGAFEYQDPKDFDHLFAALRKAGLHD